MPFPQAWLARRLPRWALLAALLPSLSFAGHWTPHVHIPGTDFYLGLPETSAAHSHFTTPSKGGDHEAHCHTGAASCSDVPFTGVSAFAVLSQTVALLGATMALIALANFAWRPNRTLALVPEPKPPRARAFLTA